MLRVIAVIALGYKGETAARLEAVPQQPGQAAKSVTNADVVSMTTAKLSDAVIVGAVQQAAEADFDLSPSALIALKNAGVSDRVLQAMQARRATAAQPNGAQPRPTRGLGGNAAELP